MTEHLMVKLTNAGLRPTRQRLILAEILFGDGHRHITAEQIMADVVKRKERVSLATVYNTLNQFTEAGLLIEVPVEHSCSYFDTNLDPHYHFFDEVSELLWDIPENAFQISMLPPPPKGRRIARVDVTVRLCEDN